MIHVHGYLRLRKYLSRLHITRWLLGFFPVRNFLSGLDRACLRLYPPDVRLRHEFNLWAEKGVGECMELDHRWFTERALSKMSLSSADRILDLGCGEGWACRLMAARLSDLDLVVGLDVSDEMVRRARTKSSRLEKVAFLCGSAEHIPCRDQVFTKVLSVSALYYFEHQERVLKELFRVVAPEGQLFILVGLYKGVSNWLASSRELGVRVHVYSADEYKSMLRAAGWLNVQTQEVVEECQRGRKTGGHDRALLISARRPALDNSANGAIPRGIVTSEVETPGWLWGALQRMRRTSKSDHFNIRCHSREELLKRKATDGKRIARRRGTKSTKIQESALQLRQATFADYSQISSL